MSADNFVGIRPNEDGTYSIFEYGCMSIYGEDCMYLQNEEPTKTASTREAALVAAHDLVNEMYICEYGVIEMPVPRKEPCGRCFVCVHERHVVSNTLEKCSVCKKPIPDGTWTTSKWDNEKQEVVTIHSSCERR